MSIISDLYSMATASSKAVPTYMQVAESGMTCVLFQFCMLRCKETYLPCWSAAKAAPTNTAGETTVSLVTDWTARFKPGGCIASGLKPAAGKDNMMDTRFWCSFGISLQLYDTAGLDLASAARMPLYMRSV